MVCVTSSQVASLEKFLFRAAICLWLPLAAWANQADLGGGVMLDYSVVNDGVQIGNTNLSSAAVSTDVSGRLVLPDTLEGLPVTEIGPFAFCGCTGLTEVILPTSVTNIGESAFCGCAQLTGINLPQGVISLGKNAFQGCSALSKIDLPLSLGYVGPGCFWKCKALKSVFIPENVTMGSFSWLEYTTADIAITNTVGGMPVVETIPGVRRTVYEGTGVFQECDALESVTFGAGFSVVGAVAFRRCRKLRTVLLPDGLARILPGAFSECPSLQEIRLPNSLKEIGDQGGEYGPKGTCASEAGAFFRCTGLRRIQIPASVEHIGDYTFAGCANLREVAFMGDEPTVGGWSLFLGTRGDLVVSVRKDAYGWYDPFSFGALSTWNGRTIVYDGEMLASKPADADAVMMRLSGVIEALRVTGACLSADERVAYMQWGKELVQPFPECVPFYFDFLEQLGVTLTADESASMAKWAAAVASGEAVGGGTEGGSSSPVGSGSTVVEAKLTVTNVVMHYVQEVSSAPSVAALPADGLVAVVSEVKGSAAIPVPCSWTNSYPKFVEMFGPEFVAALTKPTGKFGPNGTPLLVWQDFVAGTDPTDPASKFAATIDFQEGRPVVTWSPQVDDAAFPRVYRVFGKASLNDADWTELPKDNLDGYNFFKVTVEMERH